MSIGVLSVSWKEKPLLFWSESDVENCLREHSYPTSTIEKFAQNDMRGLSLLAVQENQLSSIGIESYLERVAIQNLFNSFNRPALHSKVGGDQCCPSKPTTSKMSIQNLLNEENVSIQTPQRPRSVPTYNTPATYHSNKKRTIDDLHRKPLIWKCPKCPSSYESKNKLSHHYSQYHPEDQSALVCPKCNRIFATVFSRQRHIQRCDKIQQRRESSDEQEFLGSEGDSSDSKLKDNCGKTDHEDSEQNGAKKRKPGATYCTCKKEEHGVMVGCDSCNEWFHIGCVGLTEPQAKVMNSYTCITCKNNTKL